MQTIAQYNATYGSIGAVVLLDLHLPGLSGLDVVSQLRRHDLADVPVVLMTADAAAVQAPTTTFPEYLLKPFDLDTLLAWVARYVRPRHRHARSLTTHPTVPTGTTNR
jgi:DNA-binding response OmpR family regulator